MNVDEVSAQLDVNGMLCLGSINSMMDLPNTMVRTVKQTVGVDRRNKIKCIFRVAEELFRAFQNCRAFYSLYYCGF